MIGKISTTIQKENTEFFF